MLDSKYCDMTPESRNSPLLGNASLSTFPTQRVGCPGIDACSRDNGYAQYNRRTVQGSILFPISTKFKRTQNSFAGGTRKTVVIGIIRTGVNRFICKRVEFSAVECEPADNGNWRSERFVKPNQVNHSWKTLVVQEGMDRVLGSHRLWTVISECNEE
jgi:hypothetical protein